MDIILALLMVAMVTIQGLLTAVTDSTPDSMVAAEVDIIQGFRITTEVADTTLDFLTTMAAVDLIRGIQITTTMEVAALTLATVLEKVVSILVYYLTTMEDSMLGGLTLCPPWLNIPMISLILNLTFSQVYNNIIIILHTFYHRSYYKFVKSN